MYDISSRIKELRKSADLSQKKLAQIIGVTLQAISKWENGISQPSAYHIVSLYKLFGEKLFSAEQNSEQNTLKKHTMLSIKEIYKIGRGPSSSHTIGPEMACNRINEMYTSDIFCKVILYGSLAKTGKGHGTDVVIRETLTAENIEIVFDSQTEVNHPNTMRFLIYKNDKLIGEHKAVSIGGGDILFDKESLSVKSANYEHQTFSEISAYCKQNDLALWEYAEKNEENLWEYLHIVWTKMVQSIKNGLADEGILPGGLEVHKKAKQLLDTEHIDETPESKENRLICAYAFAVSEQNASAKTIVTAPTCGSAGVLPSVLYYEQQKHGYSEEKILRALATAGIIGNIIKTNASISGAECGCQAEVGSACAMAAAALGELFELNIDKIEYASEIALEHHLGLTCDPVCGLVQIPCIERNAVAAMRAINAVSLSSLLWNTRKISFDSIVHTMAETGKDLLRSYRETAEGGLAKNYTKYDIKN